MFLYQTLDAIDGKQARRTGSSNALGELFDHGCDSLSNRKILRIIKILGFTLLNVKYELYVNLYLHLHFSCLINGWCLCNEHGIYRFILNDGILLLGSCSLLSVTLANLCYR